MSRINLANHFRGRISFTELSNLDLDTINILNKIMYEEQQRNPNKESEELIEDAIEGNL